MFALSAAIINILAISLLVESRSHFPGPCGCQPIHKPVCGYNGKTYMNFCDAECEHQVMVIYSGPCSGSRQKLSAQFDGEHRHGFCNCSFDPDPVCGSDNKTYRNLCVLNCQEWIVKVSDGPCYKQRQNVKGLCGCRNRVDPVCGVNGRTYINKCFAVCVGVQSVKPGPCPRSVKRL